MKHVLAKIDYEAQNYSLKYFRTKEEREVDFALARDSQVEQIIEAKYSDHSIDPSLRYFH